YKVLSENGDFDQWKEKLDHASRQAIGFLDRTELPIISNEPYHSVILRFDNKANAENWLHSAKRKTLLREVEAMAEERQEILHEDNTFWFSVSAEKTSTKWKQVIVSFVAVYPLTLVIPVLVQLGLRELGIASVLLSGILIGVIISACMVFFAMPLTLQLFKKWLKPNN
ncbi:MAG: hypothetical protein ICV84_10600, partial [Flavisolibacter sp.]|nr:hypothetical protein [Flavisolibacter sp.]